MVNELKWAEGTRPIVQVLQKYEFPENIEIGEEFGIIRKRIAAQAADLANEVVASAIIEAARETGISELYLIDKTFALEAIKEKLDRELKKLMAESTELRKENAALREKIEREKGKWEAYPNDLYLRCSACRMEFYIGHFPLTKKYCPNCGARMEE